MSHDFDPIIQPCNSGAFVRVPGVYMRIVYDSLQSPDTFRLGDASLAIEAAGQGTGAWTWQQVVAAQQRDPHEWCVPFDPVNKYVLALRTGMLYVNRWASLL